MDAGHELQRVAPACWTATLLCCGGVPRVMTRPGRPARASAHSRSRPDDHRGSNPKYLVDRLAAADHAHRRDQPVAGVRHARRCGDLWSRVRRLARGRPGRPPPAHPGGRRPARARRGAAAGAGGLRDVGPAQRAGRQRGPRGARPHRGQPRRRRGRRGSPVARMVGRADRPGTPARHRPVVRRRLERPRRLPGHDRSLVARPGRPALGEPVPVRDGPRPGGRGGSAGRRAGDRPLGRGPRRLDGRDAGPRVGGRRIRGASTARWSSPARRMRRPTRSRGRSLSCSRSAPTRRSAAATTTTPRIGSPDRRWAWGSPDGSRT